MMDKPTPPATATPTASLSLRALSSEAMVNKPFALIMDLSPITTLVSPVSESFTTAPTIAPE